MKMLKLSFVLLLVAANLFFVSCDKNDTPDPANKQSLSETFKKNEKKAIQEFTVDGSSYQVIAGTEGTVVTIQSGSFEDQSGNPITGNVAIELIEIYDRATMLLTNKTTMGQHPNGDVRMLISGGEIYLNGTFNGEQVNIVKDLQIQLPAANTGGLDAEMQLWQGNVQQDGGVIWEQEDDSANVVLNDSMPLQGGINVNYQILKNNWGWTNIDKWYSDPRPKTTIYVQVPQGFDNTNCEVFIACNGEPTALAKFDRWLEDEEMFTEHYGLMPIGMGVHFIAVTEIDGQLHYVIQSNTIVDDHVEVISGFTPTTQAELATLINGLP